MTTFQTPIGTLRLVARPQGYTNSVPIQHGNLCFILKDEYPEFAASFVDLLGSSQPASSVAAFMSPGPQSP